MTINQRILSEYMTEHGSITWLEAGEQFGLDYETFTEEMLDLVTKNIVQINRVKKEWKPDQWYEGNAYSFTTSGHVVWDYLNTRHPKDRMLIQHVHRKFLQKQKEQDKK